MNIPSEFHPGASASIILNGKNIGVIGKVHPNICKDNVYLMEMDLEYLESLGVKKLEYQEISKYPSIVKDVAFIFDKNITNEEIMETIKKAAGKTLVSINLFDLYEIDETKKSLAYKLTFSSSDATLTDEEITPIFEKVISTIEEKFKAALRDK